MENNEIEKYMTQKKINRATLYTPCDLHVREAEGGGESRTITGYAIMFGVESVPLYADSEEEVREVIAPGAVTMDLLNSCDIKMTIFHDRQLILARSRNGKGTLSYAIDEKGVSFDFEAPHTVDGDKALELVRRGDLSGCSFAFTADYSDPKSVTRSSERMSDGRVRVTYMVNAVDRIYDFTLAADPAYPDTSVEAETREAVMPFVKEDVDALTKREQAEKEKQEAEAREKAEADEKQKRIDEQVRQMRSSASFKIC